jgi:hypothetical protein
MRRLSLLIFGVIIITSLAVGSSKADRNDINCNSNGNENSRVITFRVGISETDRSGFNDRATTTRVFEGAKNFILTYCLRQSDGRLTARDVREVRVIFTDDKNSVQVASGIFTPATASWNITGVVAEPVAQTVQFAGGSTGFITQFPVPSSGIDVEALAIIKRVADDSFAKCSDSWFAGYHLKYGWRWTEYKGSFKYRIGPRAISQADRLNGLSWEYDVKIDFVGVLRRYGEGDSTSWAGWQDVDSNSSYQKWFTLRKSNGVSLLDLTPANGGMFERPASNYKKEANFGCDNVPK